MPEDPERVQRLVDQEFRLTLEAAYRLAAQSLVMGIEARELRLGTKGDPWSEAVAVACIAMAGSGGGGLKA